MESSSDELPEKEPPSPAWKEDMQIPNGENFHEELQSGGKNDTAAGESVKPLLLSEKLHRVLCLTEESDMKLAQEKVAKNFSSETSSIRCFKNDKLRAHSVLPENQNAVLLSEELKNVLSFNEDCVEKDKSKAEPFENSYGNAESEKTVNNSSSRVLKRPVRTATRRLRSHTRSRRFQHERNGLGFSDEADVHDVHSSITRFSSITDLQHDVSVLHIKRKRSHSADSSDFPASFSDSSPHATDPSTDEELPTCATCGKCFRKKYALVKHVFTHVPNVSKPLYVCKDCGKVIPTASVLRKHRRIHLNELPNSYSSSRRSVSSLQTRKYEEGPLAERTYRCPYCFRSFNQFDYFRRHLNVHSGRHFGRHIYRLRN
ncbi:zinc finger protein 135-like [Schistocerca piceifrons]|uniref:zinc finger protein 135-like n=1 Tax=Schistocerca piceifrons TaxID=274613 RepID=UPI001F5F1D24|nr:zinc finger protein 135-like [Schistocerca piceifrons]